MSESAARSLGRFPAAWTQCRELHSLVWIRRGQLQHVSRDHWVDSPVLWQVKSIRLSSDAFEDGNLMQYVAEIVLRQTHNRHEGTVFVAHQFITSVFLKQISLLSKDTTTCTTLP